MAADGPKAKRGRPRTGKAPIGPQRVTVRTGHISVPDLKRMTTAAGLTIILSDSDLPLRVHFINSAYKHYASVHAADRSEGAPSHRTIWADGVVAACEHLLTAFEGADDGWRHRMHERLVKGIPPDSGDTQAVHREIRLLLMRGFGEDWRTLPRVNGDLPDPWDLLYEGTPRFLEFARALHIIARRAEVASRREEGSRGGSEKEALRDNLMMHLCSAYRALFGVLPKVADRRNAHARRDTYPRGPALEWFSDLFERLADERPTPDAVKGWINAGVAEIERAEAEQARDDAEFPE